MKDILAKLIDRTLWKFILVGLINTAFGTGLMFLLYNVFHCGYWISSASNYFFGSILSYVLNRFFTFRNNESATKTIPQFALNIALCYFIAYGMAKPAVHLLISTCPEAVRDNIAMLVGMCVFVVLNYLGQRFFVFRTGNKEK